MNEGEGLAYYFGCFSKETRKEMTELRFEAREALDTTAQLENIQDLQKVITMLVDLEEAST